MIVSASAGPLRSAGVHSKAGHCGYVTGSLRCQCRGVMEQAVSNRSTLTA